MKHVRESLTDFYNKQYFDELYAKYKLYEEEETEEKEFNESEETEEKSENKKEDKNEIKDKSNLQDKEKDALDIIKKIEDDFKKFKSASKGQVSDFKTFWEENQQSKELFSETGNIYKMHNSEYVVGVLELPVKKDADGNLEGGLGAFQEEEEIIEGKPQKEIQIEGDTAGIDGMAPAGGTPGATAPMTEAVGEEEDLQDLEKNPEDELMAPTEEPGAELAPDVPEAPTADAPAETKPEMPPPAEEPPMETPEAPPMEEPMGDETGGETQTYLVVYDMGSGQRDEIFRCGSTNAVKAFRDFYQNTFKGSMQAVIQEYKEKKAIEKKQAEAKEKERQAKEKQSKVQKFLSK